MGRRSVFTPAAQERFLAAVRLGASINRACAVAGWNPSTFYKWQAAHEKGEAPEEFFQFFNRLLPEAKQVLLVKALAAIHDGFSPEVEPEKRAAHGLKVLTTMFRSDLEPEPPQHRAAVDLRRVMEKHKARRDAARSVRASP